MMAQQQFIRFGERIEEYEVCELLGKGGFATVYRARCRDTGIFVAIKIINKNVMKQARMTDRVKQEVTIHARLKHPAILELYTFFEDRDFMYLVLELAENGELQQYLNAHKQINEPRTASIIKQVVDGLLYLHSNNILHRDMSLSNLLLTRDLKVKIADFGLATQLTRSDETHMTMCGTPNYISPEVASRASHGLPADVWGLGCMMYTLLVGKPPFDTDAVKSTLTKVVMSDFTIPSYLSYKATDLIQKLLQKNPVDRISLVDVLRHPFLSNDSPHHHAYNNTVTSSGDSGIVANISSPTSHNNFTKPLLNSPYLPRSQSVDQYEPQHSGIFHHYKSDVEAEAAFQRFRSLELQQNTEFKQMATHYSDNVLRNHNLNDFNRINEPNFGRLKDQENMIFDDVYKNQAILQAPQITPQKINVPPFTTDRLLPTRQKVKNAILSIEATGEVVIEFTKYKTHYKEDRVVDVCRISNDGQRIIVYQPDAGRGVRVQDYAPIVPASGADSIFTYENLPSKHWKKYIYAFRFVQLVKAKTPKVTYYSPMAKCQLMESLEDFEACFYDGEKLTKSSSDGCKFTDKHGNTISMSPTNVPIGDYRTMFWEHFEQCLSHCSHIEKLLSNMQTSCSCFPVNVGRRPIAVSAELGTIKNCDSNFSTPRSHNMPSFTLSLSSVSSARPKLVQSKINSPTTYVPSVRVHVPGIGVATQSAQGVLKVQYSDETQLSVLPKEQGGGITFTPAGGIPMHYTQNDENELPELVKIRLEQMPVVLKYLKENSLKGSDNLLQSTPINRHKGATPMRFIR